LFTLAWFLIVFALRSSQKNEDDDKDDDEEDDEEEVDESVRTWSRRGEVCSSAPDAEAQGGEGLLFVVGRGRAVDDERRARVAAERLLEQTRELTVSVRDVLGLFRATARTQDQG
jgi:hypothetical protein